MRSNVKPAIHRTNPDPTSIPRPNGERAGEGRFHATRTLLIALFIVLAGWLVGTLALTAVYSIPVEDMHDSLVSSCETIQWQKEHQQVDGTRSTKLDTFTDAAMLGFAGMPGDGKPALQQAMESVGPKKLENKWAPEAALEQLVAKDNYDGPSSSYSRYWHGYLVWLKPALANGWDLDAIHDAKYLFQLALVAVIALLFALRGRAILIPAFLVTILGIRFWMVPLCLQYSSVFEISLIASAAYLAFAHRFKTRAGHTRFVLFLFLATGMATSYADLLTYPLATLGLPLLIMLGARQDARTSVRESLITVAVAIISWGAGYGLMWVGKWIIASAVLQQDCFANALSAAKQRSGSSADGHEITYRSVLGRVASYYTAPEILLLVSATLGVYVVRILWLARRRRITLRRAFVDTLPFLVVAVLPFAWYWVFKNHSYVHAFFAYRTLVVALGALLFALAPAPARNPAHSSSPVSPDGNHALNDGIRIG